MKTKTRGMEMVDPKPPNPEADAVKSNHQSLGTCESLALPAGPPLKFIPVSAKRQRMPYAPKIYLESQDWRFKSEIND